MKFPIGTVLIFLSCLLFAGSARAQADEICSEAGATPSLESPFARVPYVYGKVSLRGFDQSSKLPKVAVVLSDGLQTPARLFIGNSGNYCFKRKSSGNGTLTVELDGLEVARRSLSSFAPAQQREDFEIYSPKPEKSAPPGVVSARFSRPINPKTIELYKKAGEAERSKSPKKAIEYIQEIVSIDKEDFIAWAKLGELYLEQKLLPEANSAFRKSLELKVEYTPAWVFLGKLRIEQKQFEAAIEIFKHVISLEPASARAHQLLGEAYLQAKKGSLGVEALNAAIKLDPIGMAECHLRIARLYELAGAKQFATQEYKIFLTKIPDYPDKRKIEKFIKENPE